MKSQSCTYNIYWISMQHYDMNCHSSHNIYSFIYHVSIFLYFKGAINPQCVFWSFNDTQNFVTDGWSSEGLRVGAFDESSGTVTCISNHLTSFAVLVDVSGQQPPSLPLSILTYIGCGISIICLVLTVIFLLTMR